MTTVAEVLARAPYDPLVRYALLAAALLAAAALLGGWTRRDAVALARPSTWLAIAAALLAALGAEAGLAAWSSVAVEGGSTVPPAWAQADGSRVPLYLLAIGYGPTVGVVAGALVLVADLGPGPLAIDRVLLLLELAAVGWLALGPTPRRTRWGAPLAALGGWTLATVTLGLAAWASEGRALAWVPFVRAHLAALGGAVGAAVIATLPPARWWRHVPGAAAPVRHVEDDERPRWIRPLRRPGGRRRADRPTRWPSPPRPRALVRARPVPRRVSPTVAPSDLIRPDASDRARDAADRSGRAHERRS